MAEILSYNPYRDMHNDVQFSAMFFGKNIQNIPLFNSTQTIETKRLCYSFEHFTFTGKERDSETGFSYFGARYYESDILTAWLSVDPMADKYPSLSPYAYCGWNPVRLVDPDGEDIILVIWASHNGKVGHAGIAISNYRKETDANGQTKMVPDGTYTYRDLWPSSNVGKTNFNDNVPAAYGNCDNVTLDQLLTEDVSGGEGQSCDGLIQFTTNYDLDAKIQQSLNNFEESNPSYNGLTVNCSDYVETALEAMVGRELPVDENLSSTTSATTPNQVYKTAATLKNGKILKDPKAKVNDGFINAVSCGPIKQKIAKSLLD